MRRSLRFRLFAGAILGLAVALVIAGIFIARNFEASIERERVSDLQVSIRRVLAQIDPDLEPPIPEQNLLSDPRYEMPLSGSYWQVDDLDRKKLYRSRSLWDSALTLNPSGAQGEVWRALGPGNVPLIALTQEFHVDSARGPRAFRIIVAEARENPDHPLQAFSVDLFTALAILAVVLVAAAWLQISLGLRPLATAARNVERVRRGELARLPAGGPDEVRPLVNEINNVLVGYDAAIAHARDRAADLAHGLKTPLAVLAATAERLQTASPEDARVLHMIVDEMNERVDYQLRLARLRMRTPAHGARASLNAAVLRSVAVLKRTGRGEQLNWLVQLGPPLDADIEERDLLEVVGVVLENAGKWAHSKVVVECREGEGGANFVVEDDGTGVDDSDIARLGARGERLDRTKPGDGLGLAIVFDAVRLNGGSIELSRSSLGGLRVAIQLPLATAAESAT